MSALIHQAPKPEAVLAKALLNAAEQLGLKQAELGSILGLDRTGISRLIPTLKKANWRCW